MFSSHYHFNWEPAVLVTADRVVDQQINVRNVLSRIHRAHFSQAYIPRPTALFLLFYFLRIYYITTHLLHMNSKFCALAIFLIILKHHTSWKYVYDFSLNNISYAWTHWLISNHQTETHRKYMHSCYVILHPTKNFP
jgi:hypothetical protein